MSDNPDANLDLEPESEEESPEDYLSPEVIESSRRQQEAMEREIQEVAQELEEGRIEAPVGQPEPQKIWKVATMRTHSSG